MATVKYASATNASLLLAASPVFTAIFAGFTGKDHMGRQGWAGSVLAFMGVILVLLFGSNKLATGMEVWRGDLFGILASCVWGLFPIVADRSLKKYSALKTITYCSFFGTLFYLVIGAKSVLALSWETIPLVAWGSLLFSIGPVTAFGQVAWYYGISKVGANHVMSYMYAIPVVAVLTAVFLLGERVQALQIIGASIIFLGIYLIRREKLIPVGRIEENTRGNGGETFEST
jgi:drug/metabolite transporter (DMT)-like permease